MSVKTGIWLLVILLFLSGCGADNRELPVSSPPLPSTSASQVSSVQRPEWATASEAYARIYEKLNLDGVGDADDTVYASNYRWGDEGDAATVITVRLGTGEVLSKVYEGLNMPIIHFGHVLSPQYVSLVVELVKPTSNYGAASLHILAVLPRGIDAYPSITEKLSLVGGDNSSPADAKLVPTEVIMGAEIEDLPGSSLQGVKVKMLSYQDRFSSLYGVLRFENEEWVMGAIS